MTVPLRVLLVEDSETDAKLIYRELRRAGYDVESERVEDPEAMRTALERDDWDLIISDWSMPKFNGLGALEMLKATGLDIPFILVSGTIGEEVAVEAMRAGARDYVLKDRIGRLTPVVARELTEMQDRKQSKAALLYERDRAQGYLDAAEVMLLALDTDGRVTLLNRKGCDILGWTEAELMGRGWVETCVPERVRPSLERRFKRLLGGDLAIVESPVLTKQGTERLIEWRNSVIHDDSGRVIGTLSSGSDVTDRHDAEEALRKTEERMHFALRSAGVGVWDMDYATGVATMSEILEAHYGWEPGTFGGTFDAFVERIHPDDRATVLGVIEKALQSGAALSFLYRVVRPDGTVRWLNNVGRIQLDPDGNPARASGVSLDVTERRSLEDQLRQAQRMEAVGSLAGGIAHDFNNLLSVILSYSTLLANDLKPEDPTRAELQEIRSAGERAAELTKQLLIFSRKQVVEARPVDLNQIVVRIEKMLRRLVPENIELSIALGSHLPPVLADPGQIEQVLTNLVVNARDALADGGRIIIETESVTLDAHYASTHLDIKPGPHVMLAVTDNGIGMDKALVSQIFDPFFTTKEEGKGTGLGLSTVFGIVKQSSGTIEVYSEVGKGSTFKVYIPAVAEGATKVDEAVRAERVSLKGSETILLVEDEKAVRHVAKTILQGYGYHVLEATGGGDALLICESHPATIHLMLSDVVMPRMSGPQLAQRLKAIRPQMKVLFMSGYTGKAVVQNGVLDSDVAFLQKPITPEKLGAKVREVLDPS